MTKERFVQTSEYFLSLVRYGVKIDDTPPKKPMDVSWKDVYELALRHSLTALCYKAATADKDNAKEDTETFSAWESKYNFALRVDTEQQFAWGELKEQAEKYAFKLLPVKGILLKELYPDTIVREMGDIDVLYERADFKKVREALEEIGFVYDKSTAGSNHQVFNRLPVMDFEMHHRLLPETSPFSEYFANAWERARKTDENCVYAFSKEDLYIYLLLHAAKHYYACGSGVRTFLDLHLYLERYQTEMDLAYIEREIQKADDVAAKNKGTISLAAFEKEAKELICAWFTGERAQADDKSLSVLSMGVYGTKERGWKKGYEEKGKKYIWKKLFPSYKEMCLRNPVLKKVPVLLPFFYIGRLCKGLFQKSSRQEYRYVKNLEREDKRRKKEDSSTSENK